MYIFWASLNLWWLFLPWTRIYRDSRVGDRERLKKFRKVSDEGGGAWLNCDPSKFIPDRIGSSTCKLRGTAEVTVPAMGERGIFSSGKNPPDCTRVLESMSLAPTYEEPWEREGSVICLEQVSLGEGLGAGNWFSAQKQ